MQASNVSIEPRGNRNAIITYTDENGREYKQNVSLHGVAVPGPAGQPAKAASGQPTAPDGTNGQAVEPTKFETYGADPVETSLSQAVTRTTSATDRDAKQMEFRRKQAAAERVKQALLLGNVPNAADMNLVGYSSASEAEQSMTVGGKTPAQRIEEIRDRNLAASGSMLDPVTGKIVKKPAPEPVTATADTGPGESTTGLNQRIEELQQRIDSETDPLARRELEEKLKTLQDRKQSRMASGFVDSLK
jgi:hypothetical protein